MKLIINAQEVELPSNLSVKYNSSSSIFNPLQGEWLLPIVLPLTDRNNLIFDYPAQDNIGGNRRKEYPAQLWLDSFLLREGIVTIQSNTRKTVSITLKCLPGNVTVALWKKKLNEFDLGGEVIGTIQKTSTYFFYGEWASMDLRGNTNYLVHLITIKAGNDNLVTAKLLWPYGFQADDSGYKNAVATALNAVSNDDVIIEATNQRFDIKFSTEKSNVNIFFQYANSSAGTFNSNTIALTALSYTTINQSHYNGQIDNAVYALPEIQNYKFYDKQKDWCGIINRQINGKIELNNDSVQVRNVVIPQLKFPWVITRLMEKIGFVQTGSFMQNPDIQKLLIHSLYSTDKQSSEAKITFNVHNEIIRYSNHLPALTLSEFFQALINQFALGMEFNALTKTVEIFFVKEIFQDDDYLDLTDRVSFEYSSEYAELKKKQLKWSTSGDEMVTEDQPIFQPFPLDKDIENEKDKYEPIDCKFPSLVVAEIEGKRQIPEIEITGISPLFNQSKNEAPTRILFWDGAVADNKTATMAISFQGDNNLYTNQQAEKIAFENDYTPRKCKTLLTRQELIAFSFKRKILAYGIFYYCEDIAAEVNKDAQQFEVEMKLRRYVL
jgi:hypothetical protein